MQPAFVVGHYIQSQSQSLFVGLFETKRVQKKPAIVP
jgi:hypothetical protein